MTIQLQNRFQLSTGAWDTAGRGHSDPVGWKEMTEAKIKTCMYPKAIEVPPQANRLCDHYCYSTKCYVLI